MARKPKIQNLKLKRAAKVLLVLSAFIWLLSWIFIMQAPAKSLSRTLSDKARPYKYTAPIRRIAQKIFFIFLAIGFLILAVIAAGVPVIAIIFGLTALGLLITAFWPDIAKGKNYQVVLHAPEK